MQRRQPLEQSGVILFRVHPAIPDTLTPLVLRTLAMDQRWAGHPTVVTEDRVLMSDRAGLRHHEALFHTPSAGAPSSSAISTPPCAGAGATRSDHARHRVGPN